MGSCKMGNGADDRMNEQDQRRHARAQGYEDEACGECGNYTLVRDGTMLECKTCGTTTGGQSSIGERQRAKLERKSPQ